MLGVRFAHNIILRGSSWLNFNYLFPRKRKLLFTGVWQYAPIPFPFTRSVRGTDPTTYLLCVFVSLWLFFLHIQTSLPQHNIPARKAGTRHNPEAASQRYAEHSQKE